MKALGQVVLAALGLWWVWNVVKQLYSMHMEDAEDDEDETS